MEKQSFYPLTTATSKDQSHCLEKPGETIKPIYQYADAIMLTRGVLRNCIDPAIEKPIIMRVSGAVTLAAKTWPTKASSHPSRKSYA